MYRMCFLMEIVYTFKNVLLISKCYCFCNILQNINNFWGDTKKAIPTYPIYINSIILIKTKCNLNFDFLIFYTILTICNVGTERNGLTFTLLRT